MLLAGRTIQPLALKPGQLFNQLELVRPDDAEIISIFRRLGSPIQVPEHENPSAKYCFHATTNKATRHPPPKRIADKKPSN